jgi:hypothetical protein
VIYSVQTSGKKILKGGKMSGGKKNRKFGRGKRKPSHVRYNAENRREKNKKRRIEKQAKKEAKKQEKNAG